MVLSNRSVFSKVGKKLRTKGIAGRIKEMIISPIKEMELVGSELEDVLSLAQGTPSFDTPSHIKDFAIKAIKEDRVGKYVLGPGIIELRKELSKKLKKFNQIDADPNSEILLTVGANEALTAAMLTSVEQGSEVLLTSPGYSPHIEQVVMAQGKPSFVPLIEEEGWKLDMDALRKSVTDKTKAMVVCSPLNPTGSILEKKELKEIADFALENDLFLITDETYEYFLFDEKKHFSLGSIPELKSKVVSCFSFSKTYAMTGWRLGYMVAEEGFLNQVLKFHDATTICAPVVSQYAGLGALKGPQDCILEFKKGFEKRRNLIMKRLKEINIFSCQKPQGAYYVFPKVMDGTIDSLNFSVKLLMEGKVSTVPGTAFGPTGEGHIRMCFAMDEETINKAFDRIEVFAKKFEGF